MIRVTWRQLEREPFVVLARIAQALNAPAIRPLTCNRALAGMLRRHASWTRVLSFVVALAIAAALTPLAARLARRLGAVDVPRERGLALRETPLLGGLAILAGVLVAAAIWLPSQINLAHTRARQAPDPAAPSRCGA